MNPVRPADPWAVGGALRRALGACLDRYFGAPRAIERLAHRPSPYGSSYPIEELEITLAGDGSLALLYKDLSRPRPAARPAFAHHPEREIAVYRALLAGADLGTAACYGVLDDPPNGTRGLLLERVSGGALCFSGDPAHWQAAARWLAGFHARFAGRAAALADSLPLLRCDASYWRRWPARALEFSAAAGAERRALQRLSDRYERVVARLVTLPITLIHGEFYPANVLTREDDGEICPIDWEMAGVGPGLFDLAALTGGRWAERERRALARSYREAAPAELALASAADFDHALACCRLQLAVQWLGWSQHFEPPPEQRHDWLREALELAARLNI